MPDEKKTKQSWKFFRAGGVDQVVLANAADLENLPSLDQKLWVALACPTQGLEIDTRTLELIDTDNDGRIRPPEVLGAIAWAREVFVTLDDLFEGGDEVPLDSINDKTEAGRSLLAGAKRILPTSAGRREGHQARRRGRHREDLRRDKLNGDGVVAAESADDEPTQPGHPATIIDALGARCATAAASRAIDTAMADGVLHAGAGVTSGWLARTRARRCRTLGDATAAARGRRRRGASKVDDYFVRCRARRRSTRALCRRLPTPEARSWRRSRARPDPRRTRGSPRFPAGAGGRGRPLPLVAGVNPAWAAPCRFRRRRGGGAARRGQDALTEDDWSSWGTLAPYEAWLAVKAAASGGEARRLARVPSRVVAAAAPRGDGRAHRPRQGAGRRERPDRDGREAGPPAAGPGPALRNFVSFADFYGRRAWRSFSTARSTSTARSCDLCLSVDDAARSTSTLRRSRKRVPRLLRLHAHKDAEKRSIVAAFTAGDIDNLMVGRNGVFYDRKGDDWDASITRDRRRTPSACARPSGRRTSGSSG